MTPSKTFLKNLVLSLATGLGFFSCSTPRERPTRLLIYASAALRAADRAGGERKAPDAYRKAESAYWKAKTQYQLKQFDEAAKAAIEARRFAEMAEIEAETRGAAAAQGDFY
ncbi:MAG: DUF4398 domain-containing protein [Bdellovibrionota bacterium]